MQRAHLLIVSSIPLTMIATTWAMGCSRSADSCDNLLTCPEYAVLTAPEGCDGPAEANPDYYTEKCGVFVDPEALDAAGAGTRTSPLSKMNQAIAAAIDQKKRVYACAKTFKEPVVIEGSVEIVGGLSCKDGWKESPDAATTIEGEVNTIALTIDTPGYVSIRRVNVIAPNAVTLGASSIAVLVNDAHLTFAEGSIVASDAAPGEPGLDTLADTGLNGLPGENGRAVCEGSMTNPGGEPVSKDCSEQGGSISAGGKGGDGGMVQGFSVGDGGDGKPGEPQGLSGKGGKGQGQGMADSCTDGEKGEDGAAGNMGPGAPALGVIAETGYWGNRGKDGKNGGSGHAGGGGGGSRGGLSIACSGSLLPRPGPSGGSGGTGGCGGLGGKGGGAGGSSIALISLRADVIFMNAILTAGRAGEGGQGGAGQPGGAGASGGDGGAGAGGVAAGCKGGAGGTGGAGGPGGGGQGGHSLGIAFQGKTPIGAQFQMSESHQAGAGGEAGPDAVDPIAGRGADGVAAETLEFP